MTVPVYSDVYNPEAYKDYEDFFATQEEIEVAVSKLSEIDENESDMVNIQNIFPNIERALSDVESRDDYGQADTFFICHGTSCRTLDLLLKSGIYDEITKGIIYFGSTSYSFDNGVPDYEAFLPDASKLFLIGQYDGKFTVSNAARRQGFVINTQNGYFALLEGASHSDFGKNLAFDFDDIQLGNAGMSIIEYSQCKVCSDSTILTSCSYILDLMENNIPKLNHLHKDAMTYWSPLYDALHFERVYTDFNSDILNPNRIDSISTDSWD